MLLARRREHVPVGAATAAAERWEGRVRVASAWGGDEGWAEEDEQFRRLQGYEWAKAETQEFLKKQMKKGKKGNGDGEAHKYVAKYREESERCVAEVALSVKEALLFKRKSSQSEASPPRDAKKLKICQNESGSNKGEDSSGSVTAQKQDGGSSGAGTCESGSEEEKETVVDEGKVESFGSQSSEPIQPKPSVATEPVMMEANVMPCSESIVSEINTEDNGSQDCNGAVADKFDGTVSQASSVLSSETLAGAGKSNDMEIDASLEHKAAVNEESLPSTSVPALDEPLNFDAFNSAAELEVLGLEKLKSELQSRGLKCGGTLQERAARLFLLKSTPLDKLPKKLLAKK
ncbi:Telomere stability C-terminal [Sesbania bispinosa]|nr:Telomere stability C-terminal [Sesbania bispinosa]